MVVILAMASVFSRYLRCELLRGLPSVASTRRRNETDHWLHGALLIGTLIVAAGPDIGRVSYRRRSAFLGRGISHVGLGSNTLAVER
jgi:hypothetical protein